MWRATEKHKYVRAVKSKTKALRHFKVEPVLKIYEEMFISRLNLCVLFVLYYFICFVFIYNSYNTVSLRLISAAFRVHEYISAYDNQKFLRNNSDLQFLW